MLKVARLDVISSGARRHWTLDEKQRKHEDWGSPPNPAR
jgi:hypothetical protein